MFDERNDNPADCYLKREADEPHFTLLGRDPAAPVLVALWAVLRRFRPVPAGGDIEQEVAKIQGAEAIVPKLTEWGVTHRGNIPMGMETLCQAVVALADACGAVVRIKPVRNEKTGALETSITINPKPR